MPSSRMPPPTFNSVQSLYTPALLSYDPIQNVPPGHKPLGLSPRPSESKSQEESELSNGEHSTHLKFKSTKRDPGTRDSTIPAGPLIQNLPVPDLSQIGRLY